MPEIYSVKEVAYCSANKSGFAFRVGLNPGRGAAGMRADRLLGDDAAFGDATVGQALRHQREHVALARRQ
ncbi:hypothetical protein GCM10009727_22820 [Actinomadura napierensis]|uniref:Uncharacterized protein n=1 Tax=Actinomadura napierensis TaxID=267854 RepID=A0ABN2YPZ9_9ACTN